MQNETLESLPNSSNDFMKIHRESESLEEMLTATYLRALERDIFSQYRPKYEPQHPDGYLEDYQDYLALSDEAKPEGWKQLLKDYKGYFKLRHEIQEDNWSNFCFLHEMRDLFLARKMMQQADKITHGINDYMNSHVVDWMFKK